MAGEKMIQIRNSNYSITESGRVINNKTGREKAASIDGCGYPLINLYINKIRYVFRIHRLVAECYLDNPNNYEVVNHINGIKSDNHYSNLEWCTRSHNMQHAYDTGLFKKKGINHGS